MKPQPIALFLVVATLGACTQSSRFDECVESRYSQFKKKNPDAAYGLLMNRREMYERECSHLK